MLYLYCLLEDLPWSLDSGAFALSCSFAFAAAGSKQNLLVADYVLDNGLTTLDTLASDVFVCSQVPTDYTTASSTYALGTSSPGAGNVFGAPAAHSPNGRQVTAAPVSGGSIGTNGTVGAWGIVDTANTRFLVSGNLFGQAVTNGQSFTLATFAVYIPNQ